MPYRTAAEMPPAAKRLPAHAGAIWRAAFNAAHKAQVAPQGAPGGDEGKAFAVAWAAVEKAGYHKDQHGKWVKQKGPKRP